VALGSDPGAFISLVLEDMLCVVVREKGRACRLEWSPGDLEFSVFYTSDLSAPADTMVSGMVTVRVKIASWGVCVSVGQMGGQA
jgi:hypothetical protein